MKASAESAAAARAAVAPSPCAIQRQRRRHRKRRAAADPARPDLDSATRFVLVGAPRLGRRARERAGIARPGPLHRVSRARDRSPCSDTRPAHGAMDRATSPYEALAANVARSRTPDPYPAETGHTTRSWSTGSRAAYSTSCPAVRSHPRWTSRRTTARRGCSRARRTGATRTCSPTAPRRSTGSALAFYVARADPAAVPVLVEERTARAGRVHPDHRATEPGGPGRAPPDGHTDREPSALDGGRVRDPARARRARGPRHRPPSLSATIPWAPFGRPSMPLNGSGASACRFIV